MIMTIDIHVNVVTLKKHKNKNQCAEFKTEGILPQIEKK